jgi:NAD(P)-dependent dehydrogenase (short-subunit alcohol dehydrogenase family)
MELNEHVSAVVVGGASGMGEATVRALRARKVHVAILDMNPEMGNAVATEVGAVFFQVDATDEKSVVDAFALARRANGQERILVTTVGGGNLNRTVWREGGAILRHDYTRFCEIVALNLNSAFLCASVAAAGMMALPAGEDGSRGVIVMTSSTASQDGPGSIAAYVAAKAGINGMTLSMARDLAEEGIRVNTILPGNFDTPLIVDTPEEFKVQMRRWNLHPKRVGRPHEYASLALQVIENDYINAATLRADGGARG